MFFSNLILFSNRIQKNVHTYIYKVIYVLNIDTNTSTCILRCMSKCVAFCDETNVRDISSLSKQP